MSSIGGLPKSTPSPTQSEELVTPPPSPRPVLVYVSPISVTYPEVPGPCIPRHIHFCPSLILPPSPYLPENYVLPNTNTHISHKLPSFPTLFCRGHSDLTKVSTYRNYLNLIGEYIRTTWKTSAGITVAHAK